MDCQKRDLISRVRYTKLHNRYSVHTNITQGGWEGLAKEQNTNCLVTHTRRAETGSRAAGTSLAQRPLTPQVGPGVIDQWIAKSAILYRACATPSCTTANEAKPNGRPAGKNS